MIQVEGYKTISLPDCCYTCRHSEFVHTNEYDPRCEHPLNMVFDAFISENGWCPKFERDTK